MWGLELGTPAGAGGAAPCGPSPARRPPLGARAARPAPGSGREGGKHLPRELLLQLPQALPGGLHVPQELGYFIVLGFGQLHASHRPISRGRACAAAGGAKGASSAAPGPAPRPPRGRRPRSRQPHGALSYEPRAEAVRDGCGGRFPQLRPAARPGRCGGEEAGRAAIPRQAALRSRPGGRGARCARGAAVPHAKMALPWRHRRPHNPGLSPGGRLWRLAGGWRKILAALGPRRRSLPCPASRSSL